MSVLKIKNNGVWEAVSGAGVGGGESNTLVVTLDTENMTASHSASEVYAAVTAGRMVSAYSSLGTAYNLIGSFAESAMFSVVTVESGTENYADAVYVFLANDKTFSFQSQKINGVPSGGTVGQVLTMGEDEKPVWVSITASEGVKF